MQQSQAVPTNLPPVPNSTPIPVPWNQTANCWLEEAKRCLGQFVEYEKYETETWYMEQNLMNMQTQYQPQYQQSLAFRQNWQIQNQNTPVELGKFICDRVRLILDRFEELIQQVSNGFLKQWRYDQKKRQCGFPLSDENLTEATKGFQSLMQILLELRNVVRVLENSLRASNFPVAHLKDGIRRCMGHLLRGSIVFTEQPPMFIRKDATLDKFNMTIRILATTQNFNSEKQAVGPVSCRYVSEDTLANGKINKDNMETAAMLHQSNGSQASKRKATSDVMKAVPTNLSDGVLEVRFEDIVSSSPSLVAVAKSQYINIGEIFWDTIFSDLDVVPYVGRDKVTWEEMKPALKHFFKHMTGTTTELSETQLRHLGKRLVGSCDRLRSDTWITRDQFFNKLLKKVHGRNPPDDLNFSFYQWFYESAELLIDRDKMIARYAAPPNRKRKLEEDKCRRDMRGLYDCGIIQGFLSKRRAENYLKKCGRDALMIRFSDNHCGYLTICCFHDQTVTSIAPIRRDFVRSLSLPSIIGSCSSLKEVSNIFAGPNTFLPKQVLIEYETNQTMEELYGYHPLDLTFGQANKLDSHMMPPTPETMPPPSPRRYTPSPQQSSSSMYGLQQILQTRSPGLANTFDMNRLLTALHDPNFHQILNAYSASGTTQQQQSMQYPPQYTGPTGTYIQQQPQQQQQQYMPNQASIVTGTSGSYAACAQQDTGFYRYSYNPQQASLSAPPPYHQGASPGGLSELSLSEITQSPPCYNSYHSFSESSGSPSYQPPDPAMPTFQDVQQAAAAQPMVPGGQLLGTDPGTEGPSGDSSDEGTGSDSHDEWEEQSVV